MANTQAICNSFKTDILQALHNFGTTVTRAGTGADTFKGALYFATATLNKSTTAYSATGEVGNSGSYTAGGITITNATAPTLSTDTAVWTPSASWTTGALFSAAAFDTLLVYNSTQSNKAVAVYTFGSQTIVSGTFTLTMPANSAATALIQLA